MIFVKVMSVEWQSDGEVTVKNSSGIAQDSVLVLIMFAVYSLTYSFTQEN